jgi:hypothetical protein
MRGTDLLRWRRRFYALGGLLLSLAAAVIFATTLGSAAIPASTVLGVLLAKLHILPDNSSWGGNIETIVLAIRGCVRSNVKVASCG